MEYPTWKHRSTSHTRGFPPALNLPDRRQCHKYSAQHSGITHSVEKGRFPHCDPWKPMPCPYSCSGPSASILLSPPVPLHPVPFTSSAPVITRGPLISARMSGNAFCLQQLAALPLTCWDQLLSYWEKRIKNEPWEYRGVLRAFRFQK